VNAGPTILPDAMPNSPVILKAADIVKRFGPVARAGGVDFDLRGEIHALCGENGAGKSTLIKTLSGIYPHGELRRAIDRRRTPARFAASPTHGRRAWRSSTRNWPSWMK
jgi:ABC-type sugar transport system ATPase subunit